MFFIYTIAIAILILIGYTLRYVYDYKESYYLVVRIYNIVEYCLLGYFFSLHFKNKTIKSILLFSAPVFIIFCIYDFLREKVPELPFRPLIVEYITLLIFIIYFFFEVMQEVVVEPIYQRAIFWVSVAFVINFAGNFFLFLYSLNSFADEVFRTHYIIIYTTVTVIKNVLLCISIWIKETPKTESDKVIFDVDLDSFNPSHNQQ